MKRFLLTLPGLFMSIPAFAGGGGWEDDSGPDFCLPTLGILAAGIVVLAVGGLIHHAYKMKTDPKYREDWARREAQMEEERRRVINERQRRGY